jgi:hypothetical protein
MAENKNAARGFVYILTSPNSSYIKIGGTDFVPAKRIREINASEPYRSLGPWSVHDFRQVEDWRSIEHQLHYAFRDRKATDIKNQRELFSVSPYDASASLENIKPNDLVGKPKVDRLFNNEDFANYMKKLFVYSGLLNWLDIQGFWTLCLFPSTAGGRYFTLNVGSHEVAFSPIERYDDEQFHMLYMDSMVTDFWETNEWVDWFDKHEVEYDFETYKSSSEHSVSLYFAGNFIDASGLLDLPGVRRAVIAYWTERLVIASNKGSSSIFERFHNYNAVAELKRRIQSTAPVNIL